MTVATPSSGPAGPANLRATIGPPTGPMRPYLGRQHDPGQIWERNNEFLEPEAKSSYMRIRAFDVPRLIGSSLTLRKDSELASALLGTLTRKLPRIDWEEVDAPSGPFRKYFLLHATVLAPTDETTGQPMWIEVLGTVVALRAKRAFYESILWRVAKARSEGLDISRVATREDLEKTNATDRLSRELCAHMRVRIYSAVYANVMHPNVNGGFYL